MQNSFTVRQRQEGALLRKESAQMTARDHDAHKTPVSERERERERVLETVQIPCITVMMVRRLLSMAASSGIDSYLFFVCMLRRLLSGPNRDSPRVGAALCGQADGGRVADHDGKSNHWEPTAGSHGRRGAGNAKRCLGVCWLIRYPRVQVDGTHRPRPTPMTCLT